MSEKKTSNVMLIVSLCGLLAASVGVCMNSMGIFYTPVSNSLQVKQGTFALYTTISTFSVGMFQVVVPQRIRTDLFKKILIGGILLASVSVFGMSLAGNVYMFYVLAVLMGLGTSCFQTVVITSILNKSITENLGSVTGLVLSFSGVAGAICSPILSSLITSVGWRNTYRVMALLIILCSLPAVFTPLHFEPAPKKEKSKDSPKEKISSRLVFILCLMCGMNIVAAMPQHFVGYSSTRGFGSNVGSLMLSASMVGNICFKMLTGWLSDRVGIVKSAVCMLALNVIGNVLLLIGGNSFMMIAGSFLYGAIYSICAVTAVLLVKALFGIKQYTAMYSTLTFIATVVYAIALSIIGYVYDFTGGYTSVLIFVMCLEGFGLFILLSINRLLKRN